MRPASAAPRGNGGGNRCRTKRTGEHAPACLRKRRKRPNRQDARRK
nr:MAG TPA: hypothetical protein [Caudoviricetes sp.]